MASAFPELSDLALPPVLFDWGNERAAIPSIPGFLRFSGPLLGPFFVRFSCSLFSLQDKQYPKPFWPVLCQLVHEHCLFTLTLRLLFLEFVRTDLF